MVARIETAPVELPGPRILQEAEYQQPGIAVFPSLRGVINHGFTWGQGIENMAYGWKGMDTEKMILERINAFLTQLGMATTDQGYTVEGGWKNNILDVTEETIKNAKYNKKGQFEEIDCFYTQLPGVPLIGKPGDCIFSVIHATDHSGSPVAGLLHTGRSELTVGLATTAIEHLITTYGADPTSIRVGIGPGLGKKHHTLARDGAAEWLGGTLLERTGWARHSSYDPTTDRYHLHSLSFLIEQLTAGGVLPEHIEAYDIDTYEAAERGEAISHRYAKNTSQYRKNGRNIMAVQL